MPVIGAPIVARNILRYGGGFLKTVDLAMKEVRFLLEAQVRRNISRKDYSLEELAELDHPFAKRHGERGKPIYDPYWMVHTRTGKLKSSVKSGTEKALVSGGALMASAFVQLDATVASHAAYVVYGTSRMIPRPVLTGSLDQVSGEALGLLKTKLKALTINFRAG